ncbi:MULTISPECIES: terminase gpP N-terminus-related DNA-binding protein [unclassified Microbacterium]|uniref:terminase gpP N-terminus-related DNA-binding protein n=1 Tax=unclassified Microbacterium TaxID=2609290 RepID=UPI00301AD7F7
MAATGTFREKRGHEARALYDEGFSCNAIARKLGVGVATISRWAKDEGLAFDRSQTAMAVRAHTIDLAESRLLLAKKLQVAAHDLLDSLDGEYLVYSFGGKDNVYSEHTLDRPPVEVIRNAVTTAGIAFDKATKVVEAESGAAGLAPVESMLGRLAQRFGLIEGDGDA